MDIRKIKKLIEMLQDSDLTEIEVTEGEESVRIREVVRKKLFMKKMLRSSLLPLQILKLFKVKIQLLMISLILNRQLLALFTGSLPQINLLMLKKEIELKSVK